MLEDVAIVAAVRTPVGKFQGALSAMSAPRLGAVVVREVVRRAGFDAALVDEASWVMFCLPGLGKTPHVRRLCTAGCPMKWARSLSTKCAVPA